MPNKLTKFHPAYPSVRPTAITPPISSTSSSGEFDFTGGSGGSLFASSSNGWPSLGGDGFPSMDGGSAAGAGAATADGFPSLGVSMGRPRRGVLIQNMPADADYKIRIVDREHKLGITAVVETVRA